MGIANREFRRYGPKSLSFLAIFLIFLGCAGTSDVSKNENPIEMKWRLNPTSTVSGATKQFYLSGADLDSVVLSHSSLVEIERGEVSKGGRKLGLTIRVHAFAPPPPGQTVYYEDEPGLREIRIKIPGEREKSLFIKVVNETGEREGAH